jgi:hypothetical protein
MSSTNQAVAAAAHSFNKILNQHKSSKSRRSGDVDEGIKKLRRMILVEGIPSIIVRPRRTPSNETRQQLTDSSSCRIQLFVLEYGKSYYGLKTYQQRLSCNMFLVALAKFAKKSGMTHSGRDLSSLGSTMVILTSTGRKDASDRSWLQGAGPRRYARPPAGCFRVAESWCVVSHWHGVTGPNSVQSIRLCRPTGNTSTWFHVCSGNERACRPIPVHNAFGT